MKMTSEQFEALKVWTEAVALTAVFGTGYLRNGMEKAEQRARDLLVEEDGE